MITILIFALLSLSISQQILTNVGHHFEVEINGSEIFSQPVDQIFIDQTRNIERPFWFLPHPKFLGSYDSSGATNIYVNRDLAYLSDPIDMKLYVLNVSNPLNPTFVRQINSYISQIIVKEDIAYTIVGCQGIALFQLSSWTLINFIPSQCPYFFYIGVYLCLADGNQGLKMYNLTNLSLVGQYKSLGAVRTYEKDNLVYLSDSYEGLLILNITYPKNITLQSNFSAFKYVYQTIPDENVLLYLSCGEQGFHVVKKDTWNIIYSFTLDFIYEFNIRQNIAYICGKNSFYLLNINTFDIFAQVYGLTSYAVEIVNQYLFIAGNSQGLIVMSSNTLIISGIPTKSHQELETIIKADLGRENRLFIITDYFPTTIGEIKDQSVKGSETFSMPLSRGDLFLDRDNEPLRLSLGRNPEFVFLRADPYLENYIIIQNVPVKTFDINDNYAYIGTPNGLFIYNINTNPSQLVTSYKNYDVSHLLYSNNRLYISTYDSGWYLINVSNPSLPLEISRFNLTLKIISSMVISNNLFIICGNNYDNLKIIDMTSMTVISSTMILSSSYRMIEDENKLYISSAIGKISVFNITDLSSPKLVQYIDTYGSLDIIIENNLLYVADSYQGIKIYNKTDLSLISHIDTFYAISLDIIDDYIYLADKQELKIIDIKNISYPIIIGKISSSDTKEIKCINGLIYLADYYNGLRIFDLDYYLNVIPKTPGNYPIDLIAKDLYGASTSLSFNVRIESGPKFVSMIKQQIAIINEPYYYFVPQGTFIDPNNDILTFSSILPGFITFNPNSATFWGTPGDTDKGKYNITLIASDRISEDAITFFEIIVQYRPRINKEINNLVSDVGTFFNYSIPEQTFVDDDGDLLKYSLFSNLLSWISFNGKEFYGTPQESDKQRITIFIVATDIYNTSVTTSMILDVEHFPILKKTINETYAASNHKFDFELIDYFDDVDGDSLVFEVINLPEWIKFDRYLARFYGIPYQENEGILNIILIAKDIYGGSLSTSFILNIKPFSNLSSITNINNLGPYLTEEIIEQKTSAGSNYQFSVISYFKDPENDILRYQATIGDAKWLNFDEERGLFSGNPTGLDAYIYRDRNYLIKIQVWDPANETISTSFNLILSGPSIYETALNILFGVCGFLSFLYGYFKKRYLLWNWFRKSKYKKEPFIIKPMSSYQVQLPPEQIKFICVTNSYTNRCCCNRIEERDFSGGSEIHIFDWLAYYPKGNLFVTMLEDNKKLPKSKVTIDIIGIDNRIIEEFDLIENKLGSTLEML